MQYCNRCFANIQPTTQNCPACGMLWKKTRTKEKKNKLLAHLAKSSGLRTIQTWVLPLLGIAVLAWGLRQITQPKTSLLKAKQSFTQLHHQMPQMPELLIEKKLNSNSQFHCPAAEDLLTQERHREAFIEFEKCLSSNPSVPIDVYRTLCIMASNANEYKASLSICKQIALISKDSSDGTLLGKVASNAILKYLKDQKIDSAQGFTSLLGSYPQASIIGSWAKAQLSLVRGQKEEYGIWLDNILRLDSNQVAALTSRGQLAYEQNDIPTALRVYSHALGQDPRNTQLETWVKRLQNERGAEANNQSFQSTRFTLRYDGITQFETGPTLMATLEDAYASLRSNLFFEPKSPITTILYSQKDYQSVTAGPAWMEASYDGKLRIPSQSVKDPNSLRRIIFHELTHAFVGELSKNRAPCWLNEGLAQIQEGKIRANYSDEITVLCQRENWIPIKQLSAPFTLIQDSNLASLCYLKSLLLTEILLESYGYYSIHQFLASLTTSDEESQLFLRNFGLSLEEFDARARQHHCGL